MSIRPSVAADRDTILSIINEAAVAYKGIIPPDRWHDPYMPESELIREIKDGVVFWVLERDGHAVGVMGLQDKGDVTLVRHAYVASNAQRGGIGTQLLRHIEELTDKPILIGTWADATWAIDFYKRNGYRVVSEREKDKLLRTYWTIPERQIETSVVLAHKRWTS